MTFLATLHGTLALFLLCGLIFAEEVGVPLPLLPGDLLLVGAGVLIADGNLAGFTFVPLAILASILGAMAGYTWTRAVGRVGLRRLADRLGARDQYRRVAARLQAAGPGTIFVARLIPGLRINTTLVAGALEVPRRTFLIGLVPAVTLWTLLFTGLGFAIGIPLAGTLHRIDQVMFEGTLLVTMGVVTVVVIRRRPKGFIDEPAGLLNVARRWRLAGAAMLDLGTVGSIVAGVNAVARAALRISGVDDWMDGLTTVLVTAVIYAVAIRTGRRSTLGEAVFSATYVGRLRRRRASDVQDGDGHPDQPGERGDDHPGHQRNVGEDRRQQFHDHVDHA